MQCIHGIVPRLQGLGMHVGKNRGSLVVQLGRADFEAQKGGCHKQTVALDQIGRSV